MKRPEQQIQKDLMSFIGQACPHELFAAHVPNGVNAGPVVGSILRDMGVVAGFPDLIIFHKGKSYALEVKAERGKLSPSQIMTMAALREAGVECAVAYGLQGCIDQIIAWNLTKRTRRVSPLKESAEG